MARFRRGTAASFGEIRLTVLAGCLMGLIYSQAGIDWPWSASSEDAPVIARDPWAESRKSAEIMRAQEGAPPSAFDSPVTSTASGSFGMCHSGGGTNCVVDGDTFYFQAEKIRIADIDTPETHPPHCAYEAELGDRATRRLRTLLNAGPFELRAIDREEDRYGRKLRTVHRGGRSLGDVLVAEGLARHYDGGRQPWCA